MKKSLIFFIGIFLLLFVNLVFASDIAYIHKSTGAVDENIIGVFKELGLSTDLINENNLPSDFSNYKFVFIGDERFRNDDMIKIWEFPAIVSNYFFGPEWGLTDADGISKLAANSPLKVRKGSDIIQVYNKATFDSSTVGIPYYYLADENRDQDLVKISSPYLNNGDRLGAVISHGNAGITLSNGQTTKNNICFFGIIESNYWTPEAKELFKECVGFVGIECKRESDCPDDKVSKSFCKGKDIHQNIKKFMCENPGTFSSQCVDNIEEKFVSSCPGSCSNGKCVCLDKDSDGFDECKKGDSGDDGKQIDCNDNNANVNPGAAEICNGIDDDCDGLIDELSNNCQENETCSLGKCVEIACNKNSDCGQDGFIDNAFCRVNDIYQNFQSFTCLNPGTLSSSCNINISPKLIKMCPSEDVCDKGVCVDVVCHNDLECDDNDHLTFDQCLNPGTAASICKNTKINCAFDSDCGVDGFVGTEFCSDNDVIKNFQDAECHNFGTTESFCTLEAIPTTVNQCEFACINSGVCARCDENSDCNDNKNNTEDVCINPGTIESLCNNEEIECFNNDNCNDNNAHTKDTCLNPGRVNSFCSYENINCLNDNNCGQDGFIDGVFCDGSGNNDLYQTYINFTCENPGTVSSSCTKKADSRLVTDCQDSCSQGICVSFVCKSDLDCEDNNNFTKDVCVNPGTLESRCSYESINCLTNNDCNDNNVHSQEICNNPGKTNSFCSYQDIICLSNSDCGQNSFIGNLFCQGQENNDVYQNFVEFSCENPGTVSSSCTQTVSSLLVTDCFDICSEGACIDVVCNNDLDCNDNNGNTVDICVNPGNIYSRCSHEEITCVSNNDCGANRFTGELFCNGKDLYRNFINFSCDNAGTEQSFCSSNVNVNFISSCNYACSNGECIRCNNNLDCNDNKGNTIDVCRFGGTSESFCNYETIICTTNSDCGTDKFIDGEFCSNNEVFKNFKTFTCLNPGTTSSSCTSEIESKLIQQCNLDQTCFNGMCVDVMCKKDIDCGEDKFIGDNFCKDGNVFQNFKVFSCISPGSQNSQCLSQVDPIPVEQCEFGCLNGQCIEPVKIHDVALINFTNSVNNLKIEHENGTLITNKLICNNKYKIIIKVKNFGDFVENVTFDGEIGNITFSHVKIDNFQSQSTSSEKIRTVNVTLSEGNYDIIVNANILVDDNIINNQVKRNINVVCEMPEIICGEDSDCGNDGFVDGPFCEEGNAHKKFNDYTCLNPGTPVSSCKLETTSVVVEDCNGGEVCNNGMCVMIECSKNSDCGNDGFVDNPFCQTNDVYQNFQSFTCLNPGTLNSSCNINISPKLIKMCPSEDVCDKGVCVDVVCHNDLECDDNDHLTFDQCLNSGTPASNCQNTPINCAFDTDCGIDGFVGDEMCSDNDVIKNFQDAECHNFGTTESFCTLEVRPKLIDQCEFACIENGICIICDEDSDCDDDIEDTKDTCVNPGKIESFCKHEKEDICDAKLKVQFDYINNKKNGDLGPNVFVGENKIEFGNNELIPLTEDGEFIADSDYIEDVPGIALQRIGNGKLRFILFGGHDEGKGKEIMAAKLIFDGAVVSRFENDLTENHKKVDGQGNGKYELGDPEKDEVYVNDKEVLWFSTVNTGSDGFFLDLKCEI